MARLILNLYLTVFLIVMLLWLLSYVDNRQLLLTSQPVSMDTGQHGFSQFTHWLNASGYQTRSLTSSYAALASQKSDLLFVSLPAALPANQQELSQLADWVNTGNTVVVLMALDNQPHWHNKQTRQSITAFLQQFDLQLSQLVNAQQAAADTTKPASIITQLPSPLTEHIQSISTDAQATGHLWQLSSLHTTKTSLILLREASSLAPVAWLTPFGKGRLLLFTYSDLFSNAQLARADNLQLARNILRQAQGNEAVIYFDDIHHIITPQYGSDSLALHPFVVLLAGMLGYTLLRWLMRVCTADHVGGNRPVLQQVRDIGIQNARGETRSQSALRYAAHYFNKVRARHGLALNAQPVWDILRPMNDPKLLQRIERTYQRALAAKNINLETFIQRLEKLRTW